MTLWYRVPVPGMGSTPGTSFSTGISFIRCFQLLSACQMVGADQSKLLYFIPFPCSLRTRRLHAGMAEPPSLLEKGMGSSPQADFPRVPASCQADPGKAPFVSKSKFACPVHSKAYHKDVECVARRRQPSRETGGQTTTCLSKASDSGILKGKEKRIWGLGRGASESDNMWGSVVLVFCTFSLLPTLSVASLV